MASTVPVAATATAAPAGGAGAGVPAAAAVATPMDILMATQAVFVQQVTDLLEVLTGFDVVNQYSVYTADPVTGEKGDGYPLFMAKEESDCLERQCCGPNRAFKMPIFQRHPTQEKGVGPTLLRMDRPFTCTCLCLNRPFMHVLSADGQVMGEVSMPYTCCGWLMKIRAPQTDMDGKSVLDDVAKAEQGDWFTIKSSCCQCGVFCACPCEPCKEVMFNIYRGDGGDGSEPVGAIVHVFPGCVKESITNSDNYRVMFPPDATYFQKCSLLAAVFLLDFVAFDKKKNNNHTGYTGSV